MRQSFTYYLTLFVLKLKGIKKDFSKSPIDYKKIRKHDIHVPKGIFFKQNHVTSFKVSKTLITELKQTKTSNKLLLYIHGGAFISGPGKHHWDTMKELYKKSNHTIWLCDYPKAPENSISEISKNIGLIYTTALKTYDATNIILAGDSVGGTLATALVQRLVLKNETLPNEIILICPVMDASMSNPKIDSINDIDPMLSKNGILSAKTMCAENGDLRNSMLSPLFGSFDKFPTTLICIAEHDIMYPDQKLAIEKLKKANITLEIIDGKAMPHIWPLLPVMKEAKASLNLIINRLNNEAQN